MTILSVLTKIFHLRFPYDVNEDIETYIAFSLTDIDRGIWIYNDNSMDNKTSGSGRKTLTYKCSLAHLNNIKLKLQVSVRDKEDQMIALLIQITHQLFS